jgi:phosphatidate cytidylyltransferase
MFISVVKFSDIGAYTVGKIFGRHKFSPRISPGKTWEGIAGAIVIAVVASVIFARVFDIMNIGTAVLFGVVFAFLGQLGDLAESMIKRDVQIKDSAKTLPGFGGVLDLIDSPLATAPLAYAFFALSSKQIVTGI